MYRPLIYFTLCLFLSSCYVADGLFLESEEPEKIDIQKLAEKNVQKYVLTQAGETTYIPFEFTKLTIIKPAEIEWLETLQKEQKEHPDDQEIAAKIEAQKKLIRDNKIERKASLKHVFTLDTNQTDLTKSLLQIEYILNDTLGVAKVNPMALLNVDSEKEKIAEYFFKEFTIFRTNTYSQSRQQSNLLYRFYKKRLDQMNTIANRSDFLNHSLNVCKIVKKHGDFDPGQVAQEILTLYMEEERKDISSYEPIEYSELYETKETETDSVVGYYFFHKFMGVYNGKEGNNVVLVEYDPYYRIDRIFQLDQPFESYTKNN